MSIPALRWAIAVRHITATQKLVLLRLADAANDHNEVWHGAQVLADDCCLSERSVRDALDRLEKVGLISGFRVRGRSTRWVVNLRQQQPNGTPEPASGPTEHGSGSPAPRSGTPEDGAGVEDPGTSFRTTPEPASGPPRKMVQVTPEPASGITLKNPNIPKGEPKERVRSAPVPEALPDWLPLDAWAEWCRYKGRKWGEGPGPKKALNSLSRYRDEGHDPRDAIDHSLGSGYAGLYPGKSQKPRQSNDSRTAWMDTDPLFARNR